MSQATTLSAAGEIHTATVGRIVLSAQLAVGGGVTITVWSGPSRHDAVTFGYTDKVLARRRYAQIRQLAESGLTAAEIDRHIHGQGAAAIEAVRDILTEAAAHTAADSSLGGARRTAAIQAAIEETELAAEQAEMDALAVDIRAHLSRTWGPPCLEDPPMLCGVATYGARGGVR